MLNNIWSVILTYRTYRLLLAKRILNIHSLKGVSICQYVGHCLSFLLVDFRYEFDIRKAINFSCHSVVNCEKNSTSYQRSSRNPLLLLGV